MLDCDMNFATPHFFGKNLEKSAQVGALVKYRNIPNLVTAKEPGVFGFGHCHQVFRGV